MGFLDSLVSFLRHPVDFVQHAVCESNPESNSCNSLTALSQAMGGEAPQRLASISTFNREPLSHTPQTPVGCFIEHHVITRLPLKRIELLREIHIRPIDPQLLEPIQPERGIRCLFGTDCGSSHAARAEGSAREVLVGCYIQYMSSPDPVAMRAELERAVARANRVPTTPRPLPAVRETPVGCYMELHVLRNIEPLHPDAGVAPTRHRH